MITRLCLVAALLAGCGAESEAQRLSKAIEREDQRGALQSLISEVGNLGDPAAAPALLRCLEYPDAGVRYHAAAVHWRLTRSEEPGLGVLLEGILRGDAAAVEALAPGSYPADFVARLEKGCAPGEPARLRCIQALGSVRNSAQTSVPLLVGILDGPETPGTGLRTAAAWSLYLIDQTQVRRALKVLVDAYRDGNVLTRGRLAENIRGIGAAGPELVREFVEPLLADPDEETRVAAKYLLDWIDETTTPR